jgi:hypothetical protein
LRLSPNRPIVGPIQQKDVAVAESKFDHPFVAGQPPMFSGDLVSSRVRGDGVPVEVRHIPSRGHLVRIGEGASCYVVDKVIGADVALALADAMPAPSPATTHTVLTHVCLDADRGHVVRVEVGEGVGTQIGPKRPFPERPGRVKQLSFYPASSYGDPGSEIPIRAFDLRFVAKTYDEKWHSEELTGRREGVLRSLWLADLSDELEDRCVKYVFLRREYAVAGDAPQGVGRHAGTISDPVRVRPDLDPVYGPVEPLARLDVSPPAEANFRYVTEPDDATRAALRLELTQAAVRKAERRLPISFAPRPRGPMSFPEFVASKREYRFRHGESAYADPELDPVCDATFVLAQSSDEAVDGLVYRQQFYRMADEYRTTAACFHVELGGRKFVVGSSDVAEALLFLRAQADGDPRVSPDRPAIDFAAVAATGEFHGYGWSSFRLPGLEDVYLRIRHHEDGFSTAFSSEEERFPTVSAALEASYERFMDAAYGGTPSPSP